MLYANSQDTKKIEGMLLNILCEAEEKGLKQVFINSREFYRMCSLEKLIRSRFAEEVADILTEESDEYGYWVYTEFGDGLSIFCKVEGARWKYDCDSSKLEQTHIKGPDEHEDD